MSRFRGGTLPGSMNYLGCQRSTCRPTLSLLMLSFNSAYGFSSWNLTSSKFNLRLTPLKSQVSWIFLAGTVEKFKLAAEMAESAISKSLDFRIWACSSVSIGTTSWTCSMLEICSPGVFIFDRPPISNRLSSIYLEQLSSSFTSDSDISCKLWLSLFLEPF